MPEGNRQVQTGGRAPPRIGRRASEPRSVLTGTEHSFPIAGLPFATGPEAERVELLAEGDVLLLIATSGDFKVTADELWGLATDTLGNAELATIVGKNIRALRPELSLSLRDLEALSGIAAPNLHTLESGKTWPRLDTLGRVATALNVPVARLVLRP